LGKKIELVLTGNLKVVRAEALRINRKNIYYQRNKQTVKDQLLKGNIETVWIKYPSYGHKDWVFIRLTIKECCG